MSKLSSHILMLDYDGTLAPFQSDPALAIPYAGVRDRLRTARDCSLGQIVIISGRQAHEVKRLLRVEKIEIWGCHGVERLTADGTRSVMGLDNQTKRSLSVVRHSLEAEGLIRFAESKPTGYAIHWRGLPPSEAKDVEVGATKVWEGLEEKSTLRKLNFDGGIELCANVMDKGDVVERIISGLPQSHSVAYLGDDITDEDAFRALDGRGLGVLVRKNSQTFSGARRDKPPD